MNSLLKKKAQIGRGRNSGIEYIAGRFVCEKILEVLNVDVIDDVNNILHSLAPAGDVHFSDHYYKYQGMTTKTLERYESKLNNYLKSISNSSEINLADYHLFGPMNIIQILIESDVIEVIQMISVQLKKIIKESELSIEDVSFIAYRFVPEDWLRSLSSRLHEHRELFANHRHFSVFCMSIAVVENNLLGDPRSFNKLLPLLKDEIVAKHNICTDMWPLRKLNMPILQDLTPTPSPPSSGITKLEKIKPFRMDKELIAANEPLHSAQIFSFKEMKRKRSQQGDNSRTA